MQPAVSAVNVRRFREGSLEEQSDLLAAEEPLEIRIDFGPVDERQQRTLSVTMRTPDRKSTRLNSSHT